MPRGNTLESLISKLNNETGQIDSPSYGIGARNSLVNILQRTQEKLWRNYDWPFLQIHKDIELQAGSRYYNMPSEIAVDRIQEVNLKYASDWIEVKFGIDFKTHYTEFDSDLDQRYDPTRRWDYHYDTATDSEMIEVWPIPASDFSSTTKNGALRITGIKNLSSFVSDDDTADLDGDLIVLFAAGEILARNRADDAAAKLQEANDLLRRLKASSSSAKSFSISGQHDDLDDGNCPRTKVRAVYGNFSGA